MQDLKSASSPDESLPEYMRATFITQKFPVSESTVWNWAKKGLLNPIRVSKGVTVFRRDEVLSLFSGERFSLES